MRHITILDRVRILIGRNLSNPWHFSLSREAFLLHVGPAYLYIVRLER